MKLAAPPHASRVIIRRAPIADHPAIHPMITAIMTHVGIGGMFSALAAFVELFAHPAVASALLQTPEILAQVVFTPLLAAFSVWVSIGISARSNDVRVAQQLSVLASLPTFAVAALIAFNVISASLGLTVGFGAALVVLDVLGWRLTSAAFNRERLITGTR